MIYYSTPYSSSKNIGFYYNMFMGLLPNDDDWACFVDGDAMFTTTDFGSQLEAIVSDTEYDLLTCITNRVGTEYQCVDGCWDSDDIQFHREVGADVQLMDYHNIIDITDQAPISGVMILLRKGAWKKSKKFKETGMLGIDNSIHYNIREIGGKVGLMTGVYLYHWYRGGNRADKKHLL